MDELKQQVKESGLVIVAGGLDAIAKNLPFATTAVELYKIATGVNEAFQQRKIELFLIETGDVTNEQRDNLLKSLNEDGNEFVARTLLVVQRLDTEKKAPIIGKLLRAAFLKLITVEDYERISIAVERTYYGDLDFFHKHFTKTNEQKAREKAEIDNSSIDDNLGFKRLVDSNNRLKILLSSRLVNEQQHATMLGIGGNISTEYKISYLGEILLAYGF